jgi:outer membrane receptor protein involved in Fe transport
MTVFTTQQISARILKRALLGTLSATPLMLAILGSSAGSAFAQAAPVPQNTGQTVADSGQAAAPEQVVVTGSRVIRDGYQAPTPVTVTSVDQLQTSATSEAADYLNELPQFSGSTTPLSTAPGINNHSGSINGLSLRGLGANRTLTLVNGQRVVGDIDTGIVDVSELPQALIQRVDTVFGGASAAYGSDALTGVVNIILDNNYSGIKGEVSGGETNYGDDRNWKATLTAGSDFAGGRGHFEVSGEADENRGILGTDNYTHRAWDRQGYMMMNNPAYGTGASQSTSVPQYIAESQVGFSNASVGGLITSGPLKGTIFGPGGSVSNITYGSIISDPLMSGGSWQATNQRDDGLAVALDPRTTRQDAYARISYNITDNIEVYASSQWAHNHELSTSVANYYTGSITVSNQNPFIPAPVAASMAAHGITSFQMGTTLGDVPGTSPTYDRNVMRELVGADGDFQAFGTDWKWDAHASYGYDRGYSAAVDTIENAQFANAINVVRNPTTGAIVCADTLVNPNDGCVPFNLFGTGVNSQAAVNYVTSLPGQASNTATAGGISTGHFFHDHLMQVVEGFNVSGAPFSDWAGPISIATGFEHRKESTNSSADPGEAAGAWFITSGTPFGGQFSVSEGYLETVVPLADNASWAKSLDFDAAGRITGYSTFGTIETWKLGLNYATPIDGLRFRGTYSHDVREPSMVDLYSTPVTSTFQIADPFVNNQNVNYTGVTKGNPNLQPESALSAGAGVVYQPDWLPGFSTSFDYYNINIHQAITSFSAQQLLTLCYQSVASACSNVSTIGTASNGLPNLQIVTSPLNFSTEKATGFDIETSYMLPLEEVDKNLRGALNFQTLITHAMSDVQNSGAPGVIPLDVAGENATAAPPHWKYQINLNYSVDPMVLGLTFRGVSPGKINSNWITCTAGCPVSTGNNTTTDMNTIAGAWYVDLNAAYTVSTGIQMFFNVKNLFDKNPPIYYVGPNSNSWQSIPAPLYNYDLLGRVYRLGVRFDM